MLRKGVAGVVGSVVLALGCSAPGTTVEQSASELAVLPPPSLPGSTCPTSKAIWIAPAGTSAAVVAGAGGSWTPAPLFRSELPGFAGYVSYTWSSATEASPDWASLAKYAAGVGATPVQRDCPSVTALGSITDDVWTTMRAKNAERTSKLGALPGVAGVSTVQVAVVDSAATAYSSMTNDTFDHGRTVGRSIRELSCPSEFSGGGIATDIVPFGVSGPLPIVGGSGPCIGQIANFPALIQLSATTTNTTLGGYFGTQSELAVAIATSVDSWLAEPAATRPPHLVVNLSVGWDSGQGYGGEYVDEPSTLPPASRAVATAIAHAVCRGGLVVAAAGNQSTAASSGPMFPAAWEMHPGPTAAACTALEGSATLPADPTSVTYRPFVHAVGGLDEVDQPLSNTRPLGRPRMAAYGQDVVTSDPRAVHTDMLSGTSMAAANVTGIAASVWGYMPSATANQVMQVVYDNGVGLSETADFALGSLTPTIKRASLCDAVKAAMSGTFTCATPAAYVGTPVAINWATLDPGFEVAPLAAPLATAASLPSSPGGPSEPWVTSQPGSPSCTTCNMKGRVAYVGTNPVLPGYSVTSGTITLKTKVTSTSTVTEYYSFTPPAASAPNGQNYALALGSSSVTGTVTSAAVTWSVTGPTTYQTTAPMSISP
jgi:hypothetical protein